MKDKKEEQSKKWRDLRKWQRAVGKGCLKAENKEDEVNWEEGFQPLTEDEQKDLAYFLIEALKRCYDIHFKSLQQLGKAYMDGKDQTAIGYLERECYMDLGREAVYELVTACLCPNAVEQDYRSYILKTAREWRQKNAEETKKA